MINGIYNCVLIIFIDLLEQMNSVVAYEESGQINLLLCQTSAVCSTL